MTFWYEHKKQQYTVVMKVFDFIESVIKHIPQKHQKLIRYYGLLSRRLRKWAEKVIGVAYLKDNELWMIGGWRWLERRLMYREMMQRERQKREKESAQLDFLSELRSAA